MQELEITSEELNTEILTPNTIHLEEFKVRQRALHVFQGNKTNTAYATIAVKY